MLFEYYLILLQISSQTFHFKVTFIISRWSANQMATGWIFAYLWLVGDPFCCRGLGYPGGYVFVCVWAWEDALFQYCTLSSSSSHSSSRRSAWILVRKTKMCLLHTLHLWTPNSVQVVEIFKLQESWDRVEILSNDRHSFAFYSYICSFQKKKNVVSFRRERWKQL